MIMMTSFKKKKDEKVLTRERKILEFNIAQ
jgi:hypothetical protein